MALVNGITEISSYALPEIGIQAATGSILGPLILPLLSQFAHPSIFCSAFNAVAPPKQENIMPQSPHNPSAELHNLAAHAHAAAAAAHHKGEYLTAHELTRQAHEHSLNAHRLEEEKAAHPGSGSKE
jgi:hypothetical protein